MDNVEKRIFKDFKKRFSNYNLKNLLEVYNTSVNVLNDKHNELKDIEIKEKNIRILSIKELIKDELKDNLDDKFDEYFDKIFENSGFDSFNLGTYSFDHIIQYFMNEFYNKNYNCDESDESDESDEYEEEHLYKHVEKKQCDESELEDIKNTVFKNNTPLNDFVQKIENGCDYPIGIYLYDYYSKHVLNDLSFDYYSGSFNKDVFIQDYDLGINVNINEGQFKNYGYINLLINKFKIGIGDTDCIRIVDKGENEIQLLLYLRSSFKRNDGFIDCWFTILDYNI